MDGQQRDDVPPQDEARTVLLAVLFDDVIDSLARPAQPSDALVRAAERARERVLR